MTREEAIKVLEYPIRKWMMDTSYDGVYEAIDMAIAALREQEERSKGCNLCNAKWIDIEVRTVNPDDMYVFSTNEAIGLMFCPMCGRKLEV